MYQLFFDGSGKNQFRTLVCCAGEEADWKALDAEWTHALQKDQRTPKYMHMREAMQGREGYLGWRIEEAGERISRLLNVMARFNSSSIRAYVISVEVEPHQELKDSLDLGNAEQTCVEWAFVRAVEIWERERGFGNPQPVESFFDRKEGYLQHIGRFWEANRALGKFIQQPRQVDSKQFVPIQIADMLSWSRNRVLTCPDASMKTTVARNVLYPPRLRGKEVPLIDRIELARQIALRTDAD